MIHPTASRAGLLLVLAAVLTRPALARRPEPRFEHISIDQGLSQNTVYAMLQDRLGFLWIGTADGLNRYDGYRFEVMRSNPTRPDGLSHNRVRTLFEDSRGLLWIGTRNGGLNRYDRRDGTFTHYRHDPADPGSLGSDLVWAIHEDHDGRLWLGTESGGLSRLDPDTGGFVHYRHDPDDDASLSHDTVKALCEDRAGNLWIGTLAGLDRLDATSGAVRRYRPDPGAGGGFNAVEVIHRDGGGRLWLGTDGGLAGFDPEAAAFELYGGVPETGDSPIWDIHEDRDGILWLATFGHGILRFDPRDETFLPRVVHDPRRDTSLSGDRVTVLFEDRSGTFWVGTSGNGLNKLHPAAKAFEHYRQDPEDPDSLSHDMVMAIHQDRDERLWIGTWDGGLNRLDRRFEPSFTSYRADPRDPLGLASDDVRAILEDSNGNLWVGTEGGGLHRLDRATGTFTRYRHDPDDDGTLRDDDAWVLFEDRDGTLWVGTYGGGLSRYHRETDRFSHHRHDPADPTTLGGDVVRAITQDASGVMWIGTGDGGLSSFDPEGGAGGSGAPVFRRYQRDPAAAASLSSDEVLSLLVDAGGTLWVGTHGGGLNRLRDDGSTFRYYTEEDGLPSNVIYGILEDGDGRLWMSTNHGLCRFDPHAEVFRRYDVADGLQSQEFNSGAYFESRAGEMFFGGIHGFNAFFPERIVDNPYVPPVVLTAFKKFNRDVPLATDPALLRTVTLGHDDRVVSFELAALSYAAPEKNRYAYRLAGFRDPWTELGTKRDVTFTNLSPGTYTLEVRASNNDGVWNHQGLTLTIVVEPPFWRTWWFTAAAGLAFTGLLWGGHKARTHGIRRHNRALAAEVAERRKAETELAGKNRELEARNSEMERFTYTVSHDLKAPLVTIKGFLGLLRQDARRGDLDRMDHDVGRISKAADTMHDMLDDLLELSRVGRVMNPPETIDLTHLAQEGIALSAGSLAEGEVAVTVDPGLPAVHGDRRRLLEVIQNLVDNAVKFSSEAESPRIELGARHDGDEVLCWVRDNGTGIDEPYLDRVFSLFERLDPKIPGTGVGLALVRRIVEVHGGRCWAESPGVGHGSTFYFTLPPPRPDTATTG